MTKYNQASYLNRPPLIRTPTRSRRKDSIFENFRRQRQAWRCWYLVGTAGVVRARVALVCSDGVDGGQDDGVFFPHDVSIVDGGFLVCFHRIEVAVLTTGDTHTPYLEWHDRRSLSALAQPAEAPSVRHHS